jgi:hypothetical protein
MEWKELGFYVDHDNLRATSEWMETFDPWTLFCG